MPFPSKDADLVIWLNQFARAFDKHAAALGFTRAEVISIANDAAMFAYLVNVELPAYEMALAMRTTYMNLIKDGETEESNQAMPSPPPATIPPVAVEPGILPRLRRMVQRIQALPSYSDELGEEFGFLHGTRELRPEAEIAKPSGRAIGQPDSEVRVEFTKSAFDGVLIESRRTGQDEWRRLAIDNFSPYVDSRPLFKSGRPEVREYRMRFLMRDEPVGEWSDILVATASL